MKINHKLLIATGFLLLLITLSCKENFLEVKPYASIGESTLSTKDGIGGLLVGAYSLLDGGGAPGGGQFAGPYMEGPDDARVGTDAGVYEFDAFQIDASNSYIDGKWRFLYAAVNRCNDVLILLPKIKNLTAAEALQIQAEAKFLRGIYYLTLVMNWKNVPWIDENIDYSKGNYFVPNTVDIYPKIETDFTFAAANLAETNSQVGRANKWAAKSFLAKAYMFQKKFAAAKVLLDDIIPNGVTSNKKKYALLPKYGDNFFQATKHGSESVFTVQMSVNDGANGPHGNVSDSYNGTFGGPVTCCFGWFQPTFDLVDAFQTDAVNGLPLLDTYQLTPVKNDQGLASSDPFTAYAGTLDSRLDWSVGRRGIPYLDWGVNPGKSWVRNQFNAGPYTAIKNAVWRARVASDRQGGGGSTNNPYALIRFADVLLWAAECEVEVGSLDKAQVYVNIVRARAANPDGFVKTYIDNANPLSGFTNTPAANYKVGLYTGQFAANGKSYARKAVRFERRLELPMEHPRPWDMRRYNGNEFDMSAVVLTLYKSEMRPGFNPNSNYVKGLFVKGKNELLPIPQSQIDLSNKDGVSVLVQNPGW